MLVITAADRIFLRTPRQPVQLLYTALVNLYHKINQKIRSCALIKRKTCGPTSSIHLGWRRFGSYRAAGVHRRAKLIASRDARRFLGFALNDIVRSGRRGRQLANYLNLTARNSEVNYKPSSGASKLSVAAAAASNVQQMSVEPLLTEQIIKMIYARDRRSLFCASGKYDGDVCRAFICFKRLRVAWKWLFFLHRMHITWDDDKWKTIMTDAHRHTAPRALICTWDH